VRHTDVLGQPYRHSSGPQRRGVADPVVAQRVVFAYLNESRRTNAIAISIRLIPALSASSAS
jgi:hypothetical protein